MSSKKTYSSTLKIENLYKKFIIDSGNVAVLNDINLEVNKNEFICIIGASGCGKSTLLRIIGGLEKEYDGKVYSKDKLINGPGVDRGISFSRIKTFSMA